MRTCHRRAPAIPCCGLALLSLGVLGLMLACQSAAQSVLKVAPGVNYTVVASGLAGPRGLLFAPSGELYVAEQTSGEIARIAPDGRVTRIVKGFSDPHDLALDAQGSLYVAETGAGRILRLTDSF